MYFVYGCPKVLRLRPSSSSTGAAQPITGNDSKQPQEVILAIAFNPSGSLLAIASTLRVCVWSGGKDHVPLGSVPLKGRGLSGSSLLWRRDSSLLAVVSADGKLAVVSVQRKEGAVPVGERFVLPDWFEQQVRKGEMEIETKIEM